MSISHRESMPPKAPEAFATVQATVTAAVLCHKGKLLIARRGAADDLADKWEFPGGKIEDGETPEACLARELREELGIEVAVGAFLGENVHHYRQGSVRLLAYEVSWKSGALEPKVHSAIAWASAAELDRYDFAAADVPFAEKLMRGQWVVSDEW